MNATTSQLFYEMTGLNFVSAVGVGTTTLKTMLGLSLGVYQEFFPYVLGFLVVAGAIVIGKWGMKKTI